MHRYKHFIQTICCYWEYKPSRSLWYRPQKFKTCPLCCLTHYGHEAFGYVELPLAFHPPWTVVPVGLIDWYSRDIFQDVEH